MKKVVITGADGFIGSYLVKYYSKRDCRVYQWKIDGLYMDMKHVSKASLMNSEDVNIVLCDINPDLILHCAGSADVNYSVKYPIEDLKSNYITTHNLLFAMRKLENKNCKFVLFSSAAVYGNPVQLPMNEQEPINPLSPYALHKRAAEEICEFVHQNYNLKVKVLRIFSVYGPGLRKQIFWDMYNKIKNDKKLTLFGSGKESRDYIYIDDLVRAVDIISTNDSDDIYYNVANGEEITIEHAATIFVKHMSKEPIGIEFTGCIREGDPINWKADISKLRKLGYNRKVSFEEGLGQYIKWAKEIDDIRKTTV